MAFTQNDLGSPCPYCNKGKIIQFRSGKYGCSEKCWLNKQPQLTQSTTPKADPNMLILDAINDGFKNLNERIDAIGQWIAKNAK